MNIKKKKKTIFPKWLHYFTIQPARYAGSKSTCNTCYCPSSHYSHPSGVKSSVSLHFDLYFLND